MKKLINTGITVFVVIAATLFFYANTKAADIGAPQYKVAKNLARDDAFVYAYNVKDYGADSTGNSDNTEIFQKLLNKARDIGGAIVYVPAGKYKITGSLRIPKGVTLRGDWRKPVKSQSLDNGTILMAYIGRNGGEKDQPFIETEPESGCTNLTIWYPEQRADNIVPYSPTIRIGVNNYFGNEYVNIKDVTLVNSYIGVWYNQDNFGASPVVNGVYGTALKKGVEIDCIADVGRVDRVNLSPDYWSGSKLSGAPEKGSEFEKYIYDNATGVIMRRNDWSYTCLIDVDGYNIGYNTNYSNDGNRSTPNGHHYKYNLTNCKNAIVFDTSNYVGILFDDINIYNCENGIVVKGGTSDVVQFVKANITCTKYAINVDKTSSTKVLMTDSIVNKGLVNMDGGTFVSTNNTFKNKTPQIVIGNLGRVTLTGCSFEKEKTILNNSIYKSNLDNKESVAYNVPAFDIKKALFKSHMPSKTDLYVVTKAPYNAEVTYNHGGAGDCTKAINNALRDAGNNGGGIVFLPSGHYRVDGTLTIPENVELRGATDVSSVPHGSGAILESYANKGNANGTAFIRIGRKGGIRGIIINYPEQVYKLDGNGKYNAIDYPYAIQGQGSDIYVINTGIRAASRALDLATYKCDNHYVDFLAGHVAHQCVKVGGDSENGIINNLMFNTIIYACGQESKFGSFPNSPAGNGDAVYDQQLRELEFLTIGDCKNESLYNCFPYGAYIGLKLVNDGKGGPKDLISMGLGIDGSRKAIYFDSGLTGKMDFIDNQIVSLNNDTPITRYIEAKSNSNFTANLYNTDLWGYPEKSVVMESNSGTLNLSNANFQARGYNCALDINAGSDINIYSSSFNSNNAKFSQGNGNVSLDNVVADYSDEEKSRMKSVVEGFSSSLEIDAQSSLSTSINRSNWVASASTYNENAAKSLDGDLYSQWTTMDAQKPGQWYQVDMGKNIEFDTIVTTLGKSGDVPRGYKILLSNNGTDWREVASGENQNIYSVGNQVARYVKIEQTQNEGHWWAVYEFYVLKTSSYDVGEGEKVEEITQPTSTSLITSNPSTDKTTTQAPSNIQTATQAPSNIQGTTQAPSNISQQENSSGTNTKVTKKIRVKYKKYKKKYTKLSWKKIKGVKKYIVFAAKSGKKFKKIKTLKKLKFVHKTSKANRRKYKYYIVAVNKNKVVIAQSKIVKIRK